jgi:hypothetical protein
MPFRQVTAGSLFSCGVSRERPGYCWGSNTGGGLGVSGRGNFPNPVAVLPPAD